MTQNLLDYLQAKLATEVGPTEAKKDIDAGTAVLLDVRSVESRQKKHIPGSLHIPRADLAQRMKDVPRGKTVITYCSDIGCQASLKAQIELVKAGIPTKHLIGGIDLWEKKGLAVATGAPMPTVR